MIPQRIARLGQMANSKLSERVEAAERRIAELERQLAHEKRRADFLAARIRGIPYEMGREKLDFLRSDPDAWEKYQQERDTWHVACRTDGPLTYTAEFSQGDEAGEMERAGGGKPGIVVTGDGAADAQRKVRWSIQQWLPDPSREFRILERWPGETY